MNDKIDKMQINPQLIHQKEMIYAADFHNYRAVHDQGRQGVIQIHPAPQGTQETKQEGL